MSLLMEALRKAELQKQGNPSGTSSDALALEPMPTRSENPALSSDTTVAEARLPELPKDLEALDAQFLAHASQPPVRPAVATPSKPPVTPITTESRRPSPAPTPPPEAGNAARNLFEAKQPPTSRNRQLAIVAGIAGLITALAIGGYFWWQLQPRSSNLIAPTATAPPIQPPPPVRVAEPVAPNPPPTANSVPSASTFQVAPLPPVTPMSRDEEDDAPKAKPPVKPPAAVNEAATTSNVPIRIGKTQIQADVLLDEAYRAFNGKDTERATTLWRKVLANDPLNLDALHGMATLALQQHRPEEAAALYRRAIEADPRDTVAIAGLSALRAQADPYQAESQLKLQLAEQPDSPYLNFALGNLYARQNRWAEAQQSYFRAHTADTGNPDYLFNLAVSLDQMRQPQLAVQYYVRALAAAEQHPAGFDTAQLAARLKTLQSNLPR